jgi:hypothetical protein
MLAEDVRNRNRFENSLTREVFSSRDKRALKNHCAKKSISLTPLSTAAPLIQPYWLQPATLDASQQETENYYASLDQFRTLA